MQFELSGSEGLRVHERSGCKERERECVCVCERERERRGGERHHVRGVAEGHDLVKCLGLKVLESDLRVYGSGFRV